MESVHSSLDARLGDGVNAPLAIPLRVLTTLVELTAAALLLAEVSVLITGVVWRYVLDSPLTWTDELASMLFTWLAMLGAVLALARGENMRMTAIVNRFSPAAQRWCESVSQLVVALFVAIILLPAGQHASEQMAILTPALGIADGLRALAVPVGAALMLLFAIGNLLMNGGRTAILGGVATIAAIGAALWLLQPAFIAMGNLNLLVFFVLLVGAAVLIGVPIGFAFGISTVAYLTVVTHAPLGIVVSRMDEGMSHLILLAVPIFVLLGGLIEISGLARNLVDFMASLLGHVRGGLQYVLLGAMFLVSGISGSKAADMAAIAPALFPEMKSRGVQGEDLAALLSASGAMTETIPPSLVLITIGAVCSVSISALFVGGLLPALIATVAIAFVCWMKARRADAPTLSRAPLRVVMRTFVIAVPALALPVLIRAAVVEGVATATEVSTLGVIYTLIAGILASLFGKPFAYRRLYKMLVDAAALSGAILLIIGLATSMAWALTRSGFSTYLVGMMQSVPGGATGFMIVTIVCFAILGSVLEGIPAIVLFGPLLFPAAHALHINEVHYAMVVILAMGLGLFAPPFGVGFYAACAIGKTSPDGVGKRIWPYLFALLIALLLVAFIPWLSTGFLGHAAE
ncbi:TRAP transporter large permease subunit [Robbsia sp. Bb-Pol-6]|uniref:TRAP transporter large permease subunit n=1 Tax=Robbsia betulipollinis TaxID=2981849 RepID=A0ABT3ZQZ2_9BURK|nr:TRAP transporter large permease subunit [Robbsia betulipollinis]MCY0388979.1 TRAP transporter large permease subunit [Robbsia betulipollinis]